MLLIQNCFVNPCVIAFLKIPGIYWEHAGSWGRHTFCSSIKRCSIKVLLSFSAWFFCWGAQPHALFLRPSLQPEKSTSKRKTLFARQMTPASSGTTYFGWGWFQHRECVYKLSFLSTFKIWKKQLSTPQAVTAPTGLWLWGDRVPSKIIASKFFAN